jgi:hypothetical protein
MRLNIRTTIQGSSVMNLIVNFVFKLQAGSLDGLSSMMVFWLITNLKKKSTKDAKDLSGLWLVKSQVFIIFCNNIG